MTEIGKAMGERNGNLLTLCLHSFQSRHVLIFILFLRVLYVKREERR